MGAVTVVSASRSGYFSPRPLFVKSIEKGHGETVRELFGIDPAGLTADEAEDVVNFRDSDSLRNRAARAEGERNLRLGRKGLRRSEVEVNEGRFALPGLGPGRKTKESRRDIMSDDNLPAALLKSKAGEKLADAVKGAVGLGHNLLDYLVGGNRIRNTAQARADAALIEARGQGEVDLVRAQAAERLLDRELRNQRNIDAITREAFKALPPPDTKISEEPVSEDFIYRFFEECQGIGDAQMQQIWGKLLAGEVVRPGSFHPRTLRIVKDIKPADANLFDTLCRFAWAISGEFVPLVFVANDPVYLQHGLNFMKLKHLESLGLISFESAAGIIKEGLPQKFPIAYGATLFVVELKSGSDSFSLGKATFSEAGRQLAAIGKATTVTEFVDYALGKWRADGHTITIRGAVAPPQPATPTEPSP